MEDSEEYDKLIWPIMTSCGMFGCWPDRAEIGGERSLKILLRRCHRTLFTVFLAILCMGTSCEVALFWGEDMNETIECSLVTSALYMALMRVIVFTGYRVDMLYIVETIRRDWTYSTKIEKLILRDKCLLAYKLAKFFIISVVMACTAFILGPILELTLIEGEHKRILPFRGYFFFNHTASPVYQFTYAVNSIIGALGCSTIAGGTSFSLISTIHGSAKFAIVQKDFEEIKNLDWKSHKKIEKCIQRHQDSIKYAEKVEGLINFLALAQFVISTGLMCFAGFQITTMLEDRARFMKYSSFLNAAVMELFIFSYSGQCLKTESEDIAEFAYASNWIGIFPCTNLQLVIMRSRKPCTITAGKFYDMSFESFLKVLSTSFSYFTVLLAVKEE